MRLRHSSIIAGLLVATSGSAFAALFAFDLFNRADLGPDWTVLSGNLFINGNQLQGSDLSLGTYGKAASNTKASVIVKLNSTGTEYGAITIGNAVAGSNIFVKLQTQNGLGTFSHGAFYTGNNGSGSFFPLTSPKAATSSRAKLTVQVVGSVATMNIDYDGDRVTDESYQYDYGVGPGAGIGLGTFGTVSLDNLIATKQAVSAAELRGIPLAKPSGAADLSR